MPTQYVYKGPDQVSLSIHTHHSLKVGIDESPEQCDETKLYVDANYISSSEGYARIMGWPTYQVRIL